jgi:hypothetical protein
MWSYLALFATVPAVYLIWEYHIPVAKWLVYAYETRKNHNVPIGTSLAYVDNESGHHHYHHRIAQDGVVHSFSAKNNPFEKIVPCPVVSAELIVDNREGINVTEFVHKIAGPRGNGYKDWTPVEIAEYLKIPFNQTIVIALMISGTYTLYEFSGEQPLNDLSALKMD